MRKHLAWAAPLVLAGLAGACGDTTGIESGGTIAIRFAAPGAGASLATDAVAAAGLDLDGSNGTLSIDAVHMIVQQFEVNREDDECGDDAHHGEGSDDSGDDGGDDASCEKFRAPPSFLSLPLEGEGALVVQYEVPPGTYDKVELEIEEIDDEDSHEGTRAQLEHDLMLQVRQQFPEWPHEASVRVEGTFTPTLGTPRPFVAYLDAEIEIEMRLSPPLVIGEGDSPVVTIDVDPTLWFRKADGRVVDLSQWDFAATHRVAEFEFEIERGFVRSHHDD